MREDSGCLWVPQRTCCVLRLVSSQEAIIQERIVAPDAKLVGILKVDTANEFELFARNHGVLSVLAIDHLIIGLDVPIVVIFVFDRGLVEDLCRTDVIVAGETI